MQSKHEIMSGIKNNPFFRFFDLIIFVMMNRTDRAIKAKQSDTYKIAPIKDKALSNQKEISEKKINTKFVIGSMMQKYRLAFCSSIKQ